MIMDYDTLKSFCGTKPGRPKYHEPFLYGKFTVATDNRISIWVPGTKHAKSQNPWPVKLTLFEYFASVREFIVMPALGEKHECKTCSGAGTFGDDKMHPCEDCDGEGVRECGECGQDTECKECEGTGEYFFEFETCQSCLGQKMIHDTRRICGVEIAGKYCTRLDSLGYTEIGKTDQYGMLAFKFDGGQGVVMGLSE